MGFFSFLFSKQSLLGLLLRLGLYLCPQILQWMSTFTSVSSTFHSYDKLKEAFFFFDHGNNPYQISNIFHKPLTALFFYLIRSPEIATLCVLILLDLVIAYILDQDLFRKRNLHAQQESFRNPSWSSIYLLNPLSIYNCAALSTQTLDYCLALSSIFLVFCKSRLAGGIVFGLTIYQNPRFLMILPVLALVSKSREGSNGRTTLELSQIIQTFTIGVLVCAGLVFLSFSVTGSWEFVETCYYRMFFINYYEPNLSLSWHLYASIFIKYNDFYLVSLILFQIFIIIPLFLLFKKFLLTKNIEIGFLGLFTGFCFMVISIMSPTVTLYELSIVVIFICMQIEILKRIKFVLIFSHASVFALATASFMLYSWRNSSTVEPSWIFIQTSVFYAAVIAIMSEIITSLKWEILEAKPEENASDPSMYVS